MGFGFGLFEPLMGEKVFLNRVVDVAPFWSSLTSSKLKSESDPAPELERLPGLEDLNGFRKLREPFLVAVSAILASGGLPWKSDS